MIERFGRQFQYCSIYAHACDGYHSLLCTLRESEEAVRRVINFFRKGLAWPSFLRWLVQLSLLKHTLDAWNPQKIIITVGPRILRYFFCNMVEAQFLFPTLAFILFSMFEKNFVILMLMTNLSTRIKCAYNWWITICQTIKTFNEVL